MLYCSNSRQLDKKCRLLSTRWLHHRSIQEKMDREVQQCWQFPVQLIFDIQKYLNFDNCLGLHL